MELKLYNSKSASNTINKVLEDEFVIDINFTEVANVLKPVIKLKHDGQLNYNYAYIPLFEKYYFINDLETFPNMLHTLKLETDVIETYKADILASKGTVTRSKYSNEYYDGGDYRSEVRQEHTLHESDVALEFEESTILVTIGG